MGEKPAILQKTELEKPVIPPKKEETKLVILQKTELEKQETPQKKLVTKQVMVPQIWANKPKKEQNKQQKPPMMPENQRWMPLVNLEKKAKRIPKKPATQLKKELTKPARIPKKPVTQLDQLPKME